MRFLQTHKRTIQIIMLLANLIVVPFITTLLFDWHFIQQHVMRQILIYFLIFLEIVLIILLLKDVLVNSVNK